MLAKRFCHDGIQLLRMFDAQRPGKCTWNASKQDDNRSATVCGSAPSNRWPLETTSHLSRPTHAWEKRQHDHKHHTCTIMRNVCSTALSSICRHVLHEAETDMEAYSNGLMQAAICINLKQKCAGNSLQERFDTKGRCCAPIRDQENVCSWITSSISDRNYSVVCSSIS